MNKSVNNAEFIAKKDPQAVDTVIGSIKFYEPSETQRQIATNMEHSVMPLIKRIITLANQKNPLIHPTVVYGALKLLQLFSRFIGYRLDEETI
jgi:hypothetical protein